MAEYVIDNVASPIDFQGTNMLKRTLQNAKNLLMCRIGEVPFDRYRGFDTKLFELPAVEFNDELMPELDRLMMWEPDAEVVSAEGTLLPDNQAYIRVTIEVNDAIVYNVTETD